MELWEFALVQTQNMTCYCQGHGIARAGTYVGRREEKVRPFASRVVRRRR